jgi:hypothetical protein
MPIATNPYSVGIAPNPINDLDTQSQVQKYKDEEKTHIAPQVLPFDLNGSQELISALYKDLLAIRNMILAAEKNPQVKTKYTKPILKVIDNIGNEILQDIPELLDKLQLSHTMRHD